MKKYTMTSLFAGVLLTTGAFAADPAPSFGIVNFSSCVMESKLGKQEQASFEILKKQMGSILEDTEKQITELSAKFNDKEYLDSLSPEAEEELKMKLRSLNDELGRHQNQYYQVLNQANMKLIQVLQSNINGAAEKVAKEKKFAMIINKEACFFYSPALEITSLVVSEMDKNYDQELKKVAAATSAPAPQETAVVPVAKEDVKTAAAPAPKEEVKKEEVKTAVAPAPKEEVKAKAATAVAKEETKTSPAPAAKGEAKKK